MDRRMREMRERERDERFREKMKRQHFDPRREERGRRKLTLF